MSFFHPLLIEEVGLGDVLIEWRGPDEILKHVQKWKPKITEYDWFYIRNGRGDKVSNTLKHDIEETFDCTASISFLRKHSWKVVVEKKREC
jgi:hypothetical protein